ncbi:MAG: DNA gyrase subunit A [Ruminococcaceae bacterium]|nr:DNA gyrase subunit A [Oscillospiraceae bacterium]
MAEENYNIEFPDQKIVPVSMDKEIRKKFLEYSMSVIVSRALPDVRDGMKPGQRRILYAMYEDNLTYDKPFRKSATTVGDVLGRYHPHGDAAVYGTMVRMAQDFSLRYPLVQGHGNFGSIDGDGAAAYRYTEARLSKLSDELLRDLDKDVVEFVPNFDYSRKEPTVLPSRFPNLLVNGSVGIAVGMATNIPPHNMGEVIDGTIHLMDNPDCTVDDLMKFIKGPDFPTAATVYGLSGIRQAYATGKGRVMVRAKANIEEEKHRIIVTEIPYQVNKSLLVESIANLVKDKRVEGITGIRDESGRHGMRIVIECRRDANCEIILNQLYKYSQLQDTCAINMLALKGGEPKVLSLKQVLEAYVEHQEDVITRRCQFELRKALKEAHLFEGYKIALDNIDEVISIIRRSPDTPTAKINLMERFKGDGTQNVDLDTKDGLIAFAASENAGLSEVQAQAIVTMPLGRLSGLERQKIEEKLAELHETVGKLREILADREKIRSIIKDELLEIRKKFADERKTEIVEAHDEIDLEDLIERHTCVITMTKTGYVKRQHVDTYKTQGKDARGRTGLKMKEEDVTEKLIVVDSHSTLLFFTNKGKIFAKKAYRIPEASSTAKGSNIVNLLEIEDGEKITAIVDIFGFDEDSYLIMVTKNGVIKKTALSEYAYQRKGGKIAINLDEGDELIFAEVSKGSKDVFVATHLGRGSRYSEDDIRIVGRTSRGVTAIKFKFEDDYVVGAALIDNDEEWQEKYMLLTVTENGKGKRCPFKNFSRMKRPNTGVYCHDVEKAGAPVAGIAIVSSDEDVVMITDSGIIKRLEASDIRIVDSTKSKGVTVMKFADESSKIVSLAVTDRVSDEEIAKVEAEAAVAVIADDEEAKDADTVTETVEADEE